MHSKSTLLKTHDKKREMGVICNLIHKWKKKRQMGRENYFEKWADHERQQEAERCRDGDTGRERWVRFMTRGMLIKNEF